MQILLGNTVEALLYNIIRFQELKNSKGMFYTWRNILFSLVEWVKGGQMNACRYTEVEDANSKLEEQNKLSLTKAREQDDV